MSIILLPTVHQSHTLYALITSTHLVTRRVLFDEERLDVVVSQVGVPVAAKPWLHFVVAVQPAKRVLRHVYSSEHTNTIQKLNVEGMYTENTLQNPYTLLVSSHNICYL